MTWVVAHANPIAVVMLSDIRISVKGADGLEEVPHFGVKKIHHVAPTVLAGFAGTIVLGFRMIDDLDSYLGDAYDPNVSTISLAEQWAASMPGRLGVEVPASLWKEQSYLVVAGMHLAPVNDEDGRPTDERRPYASGCKIALPRSPDERATVDPFSWASGGVSIGSGNEVPEYERMLAELDWVDLSNWDEPASVMAAVMKMTIESKPSPGVSSDLIGMILKYGRQGILGSGLTRGPMATDRSLMADSEAEFASLWQRFVSSDTVATARGSARSFSYSSDDLVCANLTDRAEVFHSFEPLRL